MSSTPHIVRWAHDNEVEGPHSLTPVTCEEELETAAHKMEVLRARVFELEFALIDAVFQRVTRGMKLVKYVEDFSPDNV